jgi:chemotaxis protein methyltransferase CheR
LTHGGDLRAAEELCREVLRLEEGNAGAHYLAALCRESAGDRHGAVDHHRRATHIDPAFALPRLHLGLLARRAGDDQSARRQLAEALTLLQREDAARLTLFAGGFSRDALSRLCTSELVACGEAP